MLSDIQKVVHIENAQLSPQVFKNTNGPESNTQSVPTILNTPLSPHVGTHCVPTSLDINVPTINKVLDLVYDAHHHCLECWNQPFLSPVLLQNCAHAVLIMIRVPHWKTVLGLSMELFTRDTTSDKCTMITKGSIPLNFKVLCCPMVFNC